LRSAPIETWLIAPTCVTAARIEVAIFCATGVGGCGVGAGTPSAKPGAAIVC